MHRHSGAIQTQSSTQPEATKPPRPRKPSKPSVAFAITAFRPILIVWLEANEPQDFDELMDLRRALYSRKLAWQISNQIRVATTWGEESFVSDRAGWASC